MFYFVPKILSPASPTPGRMYAFCKIIPLFAKVKDYEDLIKKPTKDKPKGLTPDIIAQIEQDVLGIPQQIETENDEDEQ